MAKKKNSKVKVIIWTIIIILILAAVIAGAYYKGWLKVPSMAKKESNIAAKVNGEEITKTDLDKQYELFFTLVGYPEEYKAQITKELYLNQMVIEKLIMQKAEETGISTLLVSDDQLKTSIDNYLKANGITAKELAESLVSKNLTVSDLQDYFKKQIAINDFLNQTLLGKIEVTQEDVEKFYNSNNESFNAQEGQIRARHILVKTETEASDIIQQLKDGADFSKIAAEKSIDTASGVRGGELGFFTKEMMVKEFADAAFNLTVNEISKPVKTEFGWHVIQRESDTIKLNEVKDVIQKQLIQEKQKASLQIYIEQLKSNATIENMMPTELNVSKTN